MGAGRLLEEAIFRTCQFLQVGRGETVRRILRGVSGVRSATTNEMLEAVSPVEAVPCSERGNCES